MEAMVNGVPLIVVIVGVVEWLKRLGISGMTLNMASMVVGIVFGVAYRHAEQPIGDFTSALSAVIYGIVLGLCASGVYDAAKSAVGLPR
jgi:hypothetical protein